MIKSGFLLVGLIVSINSYAQTKDTFILRCIPNYDEFGNLYTTQKGFDHIPTREDSLAFNRESDSTIRIWMDSIKKEYNFYVPHKKVTPKKPVKKKP